MATSRNSRSGRGAAGGRSTARKGARSSRARNPEREVWGLTLLCFALLTAIALYTPAAGVLGRFIDNTTGALFGWGRLLIPAGLGYWGWSRLRPAKTRRRRVHASTLWAWLAAIIALAAGLDLLGGRPTWGSPIAELSGAGGWTGVLVGGTLERYTGVTGEIIISITLGLIALVLLTSLSLAPVADLLARMGFDAREGLHQFWQRRRIRAAGHDEDSFDLGADSSEIADFGAELNDDEAAERYIDLRTPPEGEAAAEPDVDLSDDTAEPPAVYQPPLIEIPQPQMVDPGRIQRPQPSGGQWHLPSLDSLDVTHAQEVDRASVEATGRRLEHTLAEHGVETRLVGVVVGPTVSRFELELAPGVKVSRITSLHKDIAYAMATPDVRILAPIPGKQAIGVEVPNVNRQVVTVGDLLFSEEAANSNHPLDVVLGRDINGRTIMVNLAKMPHLLVAGQTGSGKSSCINSMLTSLMCRATPDEVRLILVDPKRVELGQYNGLPHLLSEVVTDPKKAANALSWAVTEMERRYDLLSQFGVRDIAGYNQAVSEGRITETEPGVEAERLSFIVVILDELADLMMVAARDVEESICRIAQMARAVGIHLVIATQRPSTNVITGLIKANVPARLAFAVSSLTDSRVILDAPGAERLVGRGDGLINDGTTSSAARFQGAWVTEDEVRNLVEHWKSQAPDLVYDSRVQGEDAAGGGAAALIPGGTTGDEDDDDLLVQAMELIVRSQLGSTSMLQRKLRVGFARAGRLMDLLEERGVVGPSVGSKARDVLLSPEDLDAGRWPAAMVATPPAAPAPAPAPVAPPAAPAASPAAPATSLPPDDVSPPASAPHAEPVAEEQPRTGADPTIDLDTPGFQGESPQTPDHDDLHETELADRPSVDAAPPTIGVPLDEDEYLDLDVDDDSAFAPPPGYSQD